MNTSEHCQITSVTEADLAEIAVLVNSAYRGDSSRAGWTTEADFLGGQRTDAETLADQLKTRAPATILCLREKNQRPILGCVFLEHTEENGKPGCYLGLLSVNPKLQAQGLGKILLKSSEDYARKNWQAEYMILSVIHIRDTLIAWYERHGYKKTGKTKPFPYHDQRAGQPLRDDLYFVFFEKKIAR